jgi:hypothetical protein
MIKDLIGNLQCKEDLKPETLALHSPLTIDQASIILMLIDSRHENQIEQLFRFDLPFKPINTYFKRLKLKILYPDI